MDIDNCGCNDDELHGHGVKLEALFDRKRVSREHDLVPLETCEEADHSFSLSCFDCLAVARCEMASKVDTCLAPTRKKKYDSDECFGYM